MGTPPVKIYSHPPHNCNNTLLYEKVMPSGNQAVKFDFCTLVLANPNTNLKPNPRLIKGPYTVLS